jgi:hypothetical protein
LISLPRRRTAPHAIAQPPLRPVGVAALREFLTLLSVALFLAALVSWFCLYVRVDRPGDRE